MAAKPMRPGVVPLHEGAGVGVEGPPSGAAGDGVRLRGTVLLAPYADTFCLPQTEIYRAFPGRLPSLSTFTVLKDK